MAGRQRVPSYVLLCTHAPVNLLLPPLPPQGEWVCPACAAGRAPRARSPTTARDCLLQRHGLALARIEAIWQASGAGMHLRRGGCFAVPLGLHPAAASLLRPVLLCRAPRGRACRWQPELC